MSTPREEDVVRALGDPGLYPHEPATIEHVQTHISHVFLAGAYVYKLKKPVRFPFLDYGAPERRRAACEDEVRLNARLCPGVYLGVLPVTCDTAGGLALAGAGRVVDHVVWMRRLPADRMLDVLVRNAAVEPGLVERLAAHVAAFHRAAPGGPDVARHAGPEALAARCAEPAGTAARFVDRLLSSEAHRILMEFPPHFIARHRDLLRARQAGDHVREGHGDLRCEHVCCLAAPLAAPGARDALAPGFYVFDCVEFSAALRSNDVASEVAFLAMDLERLGRPDLAARFVAAYVAAAGDPALPRLLPFYACHRATVRGMVDGLASEEPEVEPEARGAAAARARQCFALAVRYAWAAGPPAVIAVCGLSGSGKSTLARALAKTTGLAVASSDLLRGPRPAAATSARAAGDAASGGRYTPAARHATYDRLRAEVATLLAAGRSAIADATFMERAERDALVALAARDGHAVLFLECRADEGTIRQRLDARPRDSASEARWETYLAQRARRDELARDEPHLVVDTARDVEAAHAAALGSLWRWWRTRAGR